ncbi:MAG TPA: transcription-repair coupling factor [Rhodothermales bacterium]|nr:transcription-repair coupling factor [Rhodothermales bacterium]
MSLKPIQSRISAADFARQLTRWAAESHPEDPRTIHVKGATGSIPAFLVGMLHVELQAPLLCLVASEEQAAYLFSDVEQILGATPELLNFPASGRRPFDHEEIVDPAPVIRRSDLLQQLGTVEHPLLVASAEAIYEKVPARDLLQQETTTISTGESIPLEDLIERLVRQGFQRVEFVEQPGELAARGGILDVFPYAGEFPIRIEFFGDEIDSIREVDSRTQRSVSRLTTARLVPDLEHTVTNAAGRHTTLFQYLPKGTQIAIFDPAAVYDSVEVLYGQAQEAYDNAVNEAEVGLASVVDRYCDTNALRSLLETRDRIYFGAFLDEQPEAVISVEGRPQPAFNSNVGLLRTQLKKNASQDIETHVLCDSRAQESRLHELLELDEHPLALNMTVESLHQGFEIPALKLAVYTDHQIFDRYHRPTSRKRKKQQGGLTLREVQNLQPGDFVVHIDYGIGKFAGMEKITVRNKHQEAVRVLFADNDLLYVNVNALHKLSKYTGKEGHQPRLTKLGSGQWERTKAKAKKRVKDIARDLIKLYAQRKASRGHAFPPDTIWQRELEASFEFEDTPDQAASSEAVKEDMEQPIPMDRLVCGDVGFGKTEVAIRAAFKAVQDGKQVGVLVPTTILARQHFETFSRRLANFPVRIDSISRFRTAQEQKETLKKLENGELDILIGTHRLASKDIKFKDLGLLIIDEEQHFGVAAKEKLRQLRAEVDTLTLTATPIPRTLQFSLLGARDLSIINTPPPNRQPILTEIHTFDKNLIRDAVKYETSRGGQVFFIHNRVQNIEEIASMIRAISPDTRIGVAHGQMRAADLEKTMLAFVDGKYDVLVSTNIIESGLDIKNANTIIINNAQHFGLSELHQLRGRVGRSDRKAFCYLLVSSVHGLTREARQRLQAVEEFSELGSGFNIAMRDLDIRGAGNLLGAEQSGFIEDIGFETYHKILDEAVQELRAEEFSGLFTSAPIPRAEETTVDVDEDAYIPNEYVSNNVERLNVYRRISEADTDEALAEIRTEMADRFGPVPGEAENLFTAALIKTEAQALRLPKITLKNQRLFLEMPSPDEDPYFYEHVFHPVLAHLTELDHRYVIKEGPGKRVRAIVQNVTDLPAAREIIGALVPAGMETA